MRRLFLNNLPFLGPYLFISFLTFFWVLSYDKLTFHAFVNQFHSSFFDLIFPIVTHLGDGITVGVVAVILLFINFRSAFFLGSAAIFNSLLVLFLKRVVFSEHYRPSYYFKDSPDFHFVDGVQLHQNFSFPSGHTAAAFCLYFGLALLVKNPVLKGFLFFVALVAGFSRIYLSQHFVEDALFGSAIGTLCSFLIYYMWSKIAPGSKFLSRSLIRWS